MQFPIAFIAALAITVGSAVAPGHAQSKVGPGGNIRDPTPAAVTHGVGCQKDAFGATRCADGTTFPGGPFGTTAHAQPKPAAPRTAQARPAADPLMPDPVTMIHGSAADQGNLYGDPVGLPHGTDGYGCRDTPDGQLNCD